MNTAEKLLKAYGESLANYNALNKESSDVYQKLCDSGYEFKFDEESGWRILTEEEKKVDDKLSDSWLLLNKLDKQIRLYALTLSGSDTSKHVESYKNLYGEDCPPELLTKENS